MTKKPPKWISQRAWRAASVAALIVCLDKILALPYVYWMLMTVIIILQPNLGATIRKTGQRVLGTVLGVLVGMLLLALTAQHSHWRVDLSVALIFPAVYCLAFSYAYAIFFASIILILALSGNQLDPWLMAVERLFYTGLGAVIGLLATYLLWPNRAGTNFRQQLALSLSQAQQLFEQAVNDYLQGQYQPEQLQPRYTQLGNSLLQARRYFDEAGFEPAVALNYLDIGHALLLLAERLQELLQGLCLVATQPAANIADSQLLEHLRVLIAVIPKAIQQLITALNHQGSVSALCCLDEGLENIEQRIAQLRAEQQRGLTLHPANQNIRLFVHCVSLLCIDLKFAAVAIEQLPARNLGMISSHLGT